MFDQFFERANILLRKDLRDNEKLSVLEQTELLRQLLRICNKCSTKNYSDCYPEECHFAGDPEEWVKYFGYDNLCDLAWNFIENDLQKVDPKKAELMDSGKVFWSRTFRVV